jgi:hypothetical protein
VIAEKQLQKQSVIAIAKEKHVKVRLQKNSSQKLHDMTLSDCD